MRLCLAADVITLSAVAHVHDHKSADEPRARSVSISRTIVLPHDRFHQGPPPRLPADGFRPIGSCPALFAHGLLA